MEKGIYNIRLDDSRDGAQSREFLRKNFPHFVILYEANPEEENKYRVFKLYKDNTLHEKNEEQMTAMGYPGEPHGKYAVYTIEEEVTLNDINLWKVLAKHRIAKM